MNRMCGDCHFGSIVANLGFSTLDPRAGNYNTLFKILEKRGLIGICAIV